MTAALRSVGKIQEESTLFTISTITGARKGRTSPRRGVGIRSRIQVALDDF